MTGIQPQLLKVHCARSPGELYRDQLAFILKHGDSVEVRGRETREVLNAVTVIEQPMRRIATLLPGRRLNPWLALSESLWLLAGRNDVKSLLPYNKRILDFSDDGKTLWGAYGARILPQLLALIGRLQNDSSDRRAVLSIWNPRDLAKKTLDPPCNDLVMFKIRRNHLHMTVFNRSNDLHWGLHAVNLIQFSMLQEYITSLLTDVEIGVQTHVSNSLHIYTEPGSPAAAITYQMVVNQSSEPYTIPWFKYPFHGEKRMPGPHEMAAMCGAVLDGDPDQELPFLRFAADFLTCYREKEKNLDHNVRDSHEYLDWMNAGRIFYANA